MERPTTAAGPASRRASGLLTLEEGPLRLPPPRVLDLFSVRYLTASAWVYRSVRGKPEAGAASHMSPYLHYGHISPVDIALTVRDAKAGGAEDRAAYLEELVVRRELAMNHVFYQPDYDDLKGVPDWCRKALDAARARGMATIGLTGRGGGRMAPLCDHLFAVPSASTPAIQQVHLCLYHCFCAGVEAAIADGAAA